MLLKAQPLDIVAVNDGLNHLAVVPIRLRQRDSGTGNELSSGLNVPGVCVVVVLFRRNHNHALPMEADGVKFSGLAGDQHGVQSVFGQLCCNLLQMVHNHNIPF